MLPSNRQMTHLEEASDEVLRRCRQAVAQDPTNVKALLELGDVHLKRSEHNKALSAYERVAQRYYANGTLIKAVAVLKQMHWLIARYAPHLGLRYRHTDSQLAEILETLGLVDDALDQQRHIARRCIAANDDAGSEAALIHIIRLSPNALTARNMLAELQARRGDGDTAIVTLEQVVTIALSSQQIEIALAALDRLTSLRSHPEDTRLAAEVLLERGEVGDAQLALAKLQVGYRLNPRDLRTLRLLVLAFDAVGQPRRGDEVLKEAARIARDSGARDTFARIINVLQLRAPDDPSVTALLNG